MIYNYASILEVFTIISIAVFVCLAESLYAAPKYYFKQISLENGLSQSSVKCVLVDERGVMWIGTRFGLNRFDREK